MNETEKFDKEKAKIVGHFESILEFVERLKEMSDEDKYKDMWNFVDIPASMVILSKMKLIEACLESMRKCQTEEEMSAVIETFAKVFSV